MAHVTSISIEGLLGRKDQIKFDLNRDTNIFFGDNGCGKTTLLKIINAALNRDGAALENLPVTKAEINIFSVSAQKVVKHTWERGSKSGPSTKEQALLWHAAMSENPHLFFPQEKVTNWKLNPSKAGADSTKWTHTFLPTTRLYLNEKDRLPTRPTPGAALSESQLDDAFAESINRAWLLYYSNVLQEVRKVQEEGLRSVLHDVFSVGPSLPFNSKWDPAITHSRVLKFMARQPRSEKLAIGSLEEFKKKYIDDENLRRAVNIINDVERKIETAMIPIENFRKTVANLFSNGKKLMSERNQLQVTLANGTAIAPNNLSSGEKHLIKILLAAMSAGPNTVIIDEPELSMHIDWQRVFVSTVLSLNPECQLIIASHSPEIMAELPDANIFKI